MTERVVYFLGAGFSETYGLPLVSNFLEKAGDLFNGTKPPPHVARVFDDIDRIYSRIKNTYKSEMRNIEEVLSLMEIDAVLKHTDSNPTRQFVVDVIKGFTPRFPKRSPSLLPEHWRSELFPQVDNLNLLSLFTAAIQNVSFSAHEDTSNPLGPAIDPKRWKVQVATTEQPKFRYDVVTTNYDTLLEDACVSLNELAPGTTRYQFRQSPTDDPNLPALAKLHGCVSNGEIVPPTWNKSADPRIMPRWILAREVLGKAHHLRFVGYSLPESDSYVRYLLKSAAIDSRHLKSIQVICFDSSEKKEVVERYDRFIDFHRTHKSGHKFDQILTNAYVAFRGNHDFPTPSQCLEGAHHELWLGHQN